MDQRDSSWQTTRPAAMCEPIRRALEIGRSPYSRGQADASLHLPNFMVEQVSFRSVRIKWIRQLASVVSANQIYQPLGPFSPRDLFVRMSVLSVHPNENALFRLFLTYWIVSHQRLWVLIYSHPAWYAWLQEGHLRHQGRVMQPTFKLRSRRSRVQIHQ